MGRLKRNILKTNDVYIMDCYTDIFVWYVQTTPTFLMWTYMYFEPAGPQEVGLGRLECGVPEKSTSLF